ncbi:MAG: threonylcarbamoyl-AMP synthase [Alphaproteobacteria bacterium]|nr:threonylcarbamoyl-AMP synthase [Alphaproteobacteria bacterium]
MNYAKALKIILEGGVVALPTETVYGLAGDATSNLAVSKIYEVKQRPKTNPLIIHVSSIEDALQYGYFSECALRLAEKFWPGPLTLVVNKKLSPLSLEATAGLDTIAIRVSAHPMLLSLIKESKKPLAAPSANIYTKLSPTTAYHVEEGFEGKVPVLDGGASVCGLESTILDCTEEITILRHGFITSEILASFLETSFLERTNSSKAPGGNKLHYSPETTLRINAESCGPDEFAINFGDSNLNSPYQLNLSIKGDLTEAASNLYNIMHEADVISKHKKLKVIAVAKIPYRGIGIAINDKLERGSYGAESE